MTRARVAGTVRLLAFVAVLALIVGTSVSLASADDRTSTPTPRAAERPAPVETPAEDPVVDEVVEEPVAAAVVPDRTATAASASGRVPTASLPLTGDAQVRWLLLGGATFVLLGMLVQVAGQPLPARAHQRARS